MKKVKDLTTEELKAIILDTLKEYENGKDEVWSIQQASAYTKLALPTLYTMTSRKQIPFRKSGKRIIFSKRELMEWMKERSKAT